MVAVALAMTCVLLMKGRQTEKHPGMTAFSTVPSRDGVIQVSGDVTHPGIYQFDDKNMTNSVIQMAMPRCGEVRVTVDKSLLDRLQSGSKLHIDCKGPENRLFVSVTPMMSSQCLTLGLPLDLNRMNEADFELLPGIGPALAGRIVQYRQKNGEFRRLDELLEIEGIGENKFKKLSHYFKTPKQKGNHGQ